MNKQNNCPNRSKELAGHSAPALLEMRALWVSHERGHRQMDRSAQMDQARRVISAIDIELRARGAA